MAGAEHNAQVVISGGGPVGMGLAITLAQRGIRSLVVERYPEPNPIPRGQNLTQRTMEHFHFWGAEQELRAARTIPKEFGIGGMTSYGSLLSRYHYDWLQRGLVREFYFTDNERLPQYATEAVLRRRTASLPEVRIVYGWSVQSVEQDESGVRVEIKERGGPGKRILSAEYVVGCDGTKSVVREAAGIGQTRSDHDRLMVLLVFRSEALHGLLERFPGKSFFNVLHPELEGYWRFFGRVDLGQTWFFHAPVPPGTTQKSEDFAGLLHAAVGAEFDLEILHVGFWDLRFAIANAYRKGRIFVAGDAAHSHPPYGGYGINLGFEDAVNLGWKLAAVLNGWGGAQLLDSYHAERHPVFASAARDFIEKAILDDRDFLASFDPERDREGFERAWSGRALAAAAEVGAFEPNYEGSPIVLSGSGALPSSIGEHRHEARAGHHLSPQALSDRSNVYAALGRGFTLLALSADEVSVSRFEAAAERLQVPLRIVRDSRSEGRVRWNAGLVLVRPDQFVAWAGEERAAADPDGILRTAAGH
jgi:2-polyprenyl-6-methoxyphenol hydroxylase-like FAD-dependent oxidoreductase